MKRSEIVQGGIYRGEDRVIRQVVSVRDESLMWCLCNYKRELINEYGRCKIQTFARWAKERVE